MSPFLTYPTTHQPFLVSPPTGQHYYRPVSLQSVTPDDRAFLTRCGMSMDVLDIHITVDKQENGLTRVTTSSSSTAPATATATATATNKDTAVSGAAATAVDAKKVGDGQSWGTDPPTEGRASTAAAVAGAATATGTGTGTTASGVGGAATGGEDELRTSPHHAAPATPAPVHIVAAHEGVVIELDYGHFLEWSPRSELSCVVQSDGAGSLHALAGGMEEWAGIAVEEHTLTLPVTQQQSRLPMPSAATTTAHIPAPSSVSAILTHGNHKVCMWVRITTTMPSLFCSITQYLTTR